MNLALNLQYDFKSYLQYDLNSEPTEETFVKYIPINKYL